MYPSGHFSKRIWYEKALYVRLKTANDVSQVLNMYEPNANMAVRKKQRRLLFYIVDCDWLLLGYVHAFFAL